MAPRPTDVRRLARAHRAAEIRRAARLAAAISAYYRRRVIFKSPESVEAWLNIAVPRIVAEHEKSADAGAKYGNVMRELELGTISTDSFKFEPKITVAPEQAKTSLVVVGPRVHVKKIDEVARLDVSPTMRKAMLERAADEAATSIAGSVLRHVQNGSRRTIEDGVRRDTKVMGYVRVTREAPCYFCAMLASRGLELPGQYKADSFARSDPRFVGPGDAKVHDNCQCSLKAVYRPDDEILADNARFEALWYDLSSTGEADALTNFRRNYEGRPVDKRRRTTTNSG